MCAIKKGGTKLKSHNRVFVTGAGGFIGGHLVADFRKQGYKQIRAVDVKPFDEWYQRFNDVENLRLDLNIKENCELAPRAQTRSITSRRTWAAWASSRIIKRSACCPF